MGTAFIEACCDTGPELCSPPANQVSLALRINLFSFCGYVTPFVVDAFSWDYLLFGDCEFRCEAMRRGWTEGSFLITHILPRVIHANWAFVADVRQNVR